eukprot:UN32062
MPRITTRIRTSINEEWYSLMPRRNEVAAYSLFINKKVAKDPTNIQEINTDDLSLLERISDGIILAHLINLIQPDTVDFRAMNIPNTSGYLEDEKKIENHKVNIDAARFVGVTVTDIQATDFLGHGEDHNKVLDFIGQLILLQVCSSINVIKHPELIRLLKPREQPNILLGLNPRQILLRWMNYHLKLACSKRTVRDFHKDVQDSAAFIIVMNRLDSSLCDTKGLKNDDLERRSQKVIKNAFNMGADIFIQPSDIVEGCEPLNLIFGASLFNCNHGLTPV